MYSPTLGRWVQQDPAGYVDGASLYQVVRSSPASEVDPSGLFIPSHHKMLTLTAVYRTIRDGEPTWTPKAAQSIASTDVWTDFWKFFSFSNHFQDQFGVAVISGYMMALEGPCITVEKAITYIGRVLHAVQDAYSHTDWVDGWNMVNFYGEKKFKEQGAKNPPHDYTFSLSNLEVGDMSEFSNTIFYEGGLDANLPTSGHGMYAVDDFGRGRSSPKMLSPKAFMNAYRLAEDSSVEFIQWVNSPDRVNAAVFEKVRNL